MRAKHEDVKGQLSIKCKGLYPNKAIALRCAGRLRRLRRVHLIR